MKDEMEQGEFTEEELAFLERLQTLPEWVNRERFIAESRRFMENLMEQAKERIYH